jgi:hypothetical protein
VLKKRDSSTTNVSSILIGTLVAGLAVGFPVGYMARQLYAASPNTDVASLQFNK